MSTLTMKKAKVETKVRVMEVTPDMARKWLASNTKNRELKDSRVLEILHWMKSGEWTLTTDAIGFDINGVLNNGQHRLHALVKYGKPLQFLVADGLSEEAFDVIDTNKVRSAGDVLGVNGFASATHRSGIIKFVMTYKRSTVGMANLVKGGYKISNKDILEYALKYRTQVDEAGIIAQKTISKFRGLENRFVGGLYWLFAEKDKDQAELFFNYFSDGVGLTPNDPILILRQKLIQNMANSKKATAEDKIAWTILAWNSVRSGKKIKIIRWSKEESTFPKPI